MIIVLAGRLLWTSPPQRPGLSPPIGPPLFREPSRSRVRRRTDARPTTRPCDSRISRAGFTKPLLRRRLGCPATATFDARVLKAEGFVGIWGGRHSV